MFEIQRKRFTLKIPFTPIHRDLLSSYLSDPVKFLITRTLQYSLDLGWYLENLKSRTLQGESRRDKKYSVVNKFYISLIRNARFLKELANLWEVRKTEFIGLFEVFKSEFFNKYKDYLFSKIGYEETYKLLERMSLTAVEVANKKFYASLDDVISEMKMGKILKEKVKKFLKEDENENITNQ